MLSYQSGEALQSMRRKPSFITSNKRLGGRRHARSRSPQPSAPLSIRYDFDVFALVHLIYLKQIGAGFTNDEGQKVAVSSYELAPAGVILDAELTLATPERLWYFIQHHCNSDRRLIKV